MEEMASLDGGGPFPLPSPGYLRRDRDGASFWPFEETVVLLLLYDTLIHYHLVFWLQTPHLIDISL